MIKGMADRFGTIKRLDKIAAAEIPFEFFMDPVAKGPGWA